MARPIAFEKPKALSIQIPGYNPDQEMMKLELRMQRKREQGPPKARTSPNPKTNHGEDSCHHILSNN